MGDVSRELSDNVSALWKGGLFLDGGFPCRVPRTKKGMSASEGII